MRTALLTACVSLMAATAAATPISDKYAALGGKTGLLGDKTGPETTVGSGKMQTFKNGNIYYADSAHGAFEVQGLILQKYNALGGPTGELGFPVTDEMAMYDNWGRVSKFQRGQLIYRPTPGDVSEVKVSDLQVDLPTPPGESWNVVQTYNGASHSGPWVYCYDFYSADGKTQGKPVSSSADANIVLFEDSHVSGAANEANFVGQRLGQGRYASSLHIEKGSYWKHRPAHELWIGWPGYAVKSGQVIANVGDTGTGVGNYHLHYCVTTEPDRNIFKPFESVPVSFRNFEISKDNSHWSTVAVGIPMTGDFVRRKANTSGGAATVNSATAPVNFGAVKGEITFPPGIKAVSGGKVHIAVQTAWGEPVASETIAIITGINDAGPVKYSFSKVVDFTGMKVTAALEGAVIPNIYTMSGESATFNLAPASTATVNLSFKTQKIPS